jgi:hypothetical protein
LETFYAAVPKQEYRVERIGILGREDEIAVTVLQAVSDLGLRIPGEVKIVGFEVVQVSRYLPQAQIMIYFRKFLMGKLGAPMVGRFSSIFAYAQDCWALMLAPVMAVFVTAIFWKGMSRTAAVSVLFLAIPMLLIVFIRELTGFLSSFNIFNLSAILFVISIGVIALISRFTTAPLSEEIKTTIWHPEMLRLPEEETRNGYPLWKQIGFWFSILTILLTIIYAVFW